MTRKQVQAMYPDLEILEFEMKLLEFNARGIRDHIWARVKMRHATDFVPLCPQCQQPGSRHTAHSLTVLDWIDDQRVVLSVVQQRWRCREHGLWAEVLPFRSPRHPKLSNRLEAKILELLRAGQTALAIAQAHGISRQLVDKIRSEAQLPAAKPWASRDP